MEIEVKEQHIREGKPEEGLCCPIALAIQDATGLKLFVSDREFMRYHKGVYHTADNEPMPPECVRFVHDFDASEAPTAVKPFSFELPDTLIARWKEQGLDRA